MLTCVIGKQGNMAVPLVALLRDLAKLVGWQYF